MVKRHYITVYSINGTPLQNTFQCSIEVTFVGGESAMYKTEKILSAIAKNHENFFNSVIKTDDIVLRLLTEI